jgi:hypothetical protein
MILSSCNSGNRPAVVIHDDKDQKFRHFEWLIGSWANLSDDGNFYENWTKINDSSYSAFSYMTITGDTVFSETVELKLVDNEIYYVVAASGQNEGQAVSFRLVSNENGEFVFENKGHDFPQRIIYKHPAPDSIHARIEGTVNGKFSMQEFPMKRYHQ